MNTLKSTNFEISSCQAVIFTPLDDVQPRRIIEDFYPRWASFFDDDPVIHPHFPAFPREVPRIILQSKGGTWRCEIASERLNFFFFRTDLEPSETTIESFFVQASSFFIDYFRSFSPKIGRMAALLTRFAKIEHPGIFLAHHFCKETWWSAPLNSPESFELHAHKRFSLDGKFQVNSWVRNKTGRLTTGEKEEPVILFEQDINTLSEEIEKISFNEVEMIHFFKAAVSEFDTILNLYFPA